jgi:hydrogenase nickel incorporation protein HypA/HybF
MGVTQEVLLAVLDASEKAGATRVNRVRLTIGELTEVVPDALQFAWAALTPGTLAEGAVLEIRETGGRSVCLQCGTEFDHDRFDRRCTAPGCGSFATKVIVGDELTIDGVDVEVPDDPVSGSVDMEE